MEETLRDNCTYCQYLFTLKGPFMFCVTAFRRPFFIIKFHVPSLKTTVGTLRNLLFSADKA